MEAKVEILVGQILSKGIRFIESGRSVRDAADRMAEHRMGSLLVKGTSGFDGIITEVDIVRKVVAKGLDPGTVSVNQVMSSPLLTVEANRSVLEANELMERKQIRHLAVTHDGKIIGVLSVRDLLKPLYLEEEINR